MARVIKGKEVKSDFTIISNEVLFDLKLSLKEIGLYLQLKSLPPNWSFSIQGTKKICAGGRTTLNAALDKLEAAGVVKIELLRDKKNRFAGQKAIVSEPKGAEKEPYTIVPNAICRDETVTLAEMGYYAILHSFSPTYDVDKKRLAKKLGNGEAMIVNAEKGLIDKGYLEKECAGRFESTTLHLYSESKVKDKKRKEK